MHTKPNKLNVKVVSGRSGFTRFFLKLLNVVKTAAPAEHVTDNISINAEYFIYIFKSIINCPPTETAHIRGLPLPTAQ
jgi:hypothetical protein